ncbi:MAG: hypothetical protein AAFX85_20010, partial [Pseudomonadota bacterium]
MHFRIASTCAVAWLSLATLATAAGDDSVTASTSPSTTWTYTYLKATDGNREHLRAFVEQNWFAMDARAVAQGLFKDYGLIENLSEEATREWDFIVAVEYFGDQSYTDIAEPFEAIRREHQTQLIVGRS